MNDNTRSEFRVRLIAQAPAMLQALRDIVDAYTLECNPTEVQRRINVAVDIIRSIDNTLTGEWKE